MEAIINTPYVPPVVARSADNVIVMEFNELCPSLLDRWMNEGRLPNFKRLHQQSDVFVTEADVKDPAQLEPWIQWYSTHTGLAYDQHQVYHLTEGAHAKHEDIYQTLMQAGRSVCCFAGMNVRGFAKPGSVFVGDPWTENGDAYPAELNTYNRFVSRNVREYSNPNDRLTAKDYAGFLGYMLGHGLRLSTIRRLATQLVVERTSDRRLSYRRASLLDLMQFDVFRWYYKRNRPSFATFFINSTAHMQHAYWRHHDPDAFEVKPRADEMSVYGDAIRSGYEAMDKLVGEFLELAQSTGARLVFMTALSQQPFLRLESKGGQKFYRLHDVERFLRQWNIAYTEVSPTMTNQYLVRFNSAEEVRAAREQLSAFTIENGQRVIDIRDAEDNALYFGCGLHGSVAKDSQVNDQLGGKQVKFGDMLYAIDVMKSGCHHPHGALWITGGSGDRHASLVSILDVYPTLLDLLGVDKPATGERRGASLAPLLKDAVVAGPTTVSQPAMA
ncbi:hypothetical protein [Massilia sp. HP4]|uniref:hypothetical protein n=1 Tax=Massilia sp. HP4 TaxID=2562316 RepID=UPI0010C05B14|nr:hypothetical protein [Massilia sp. HP4]